MKLKKMDMKLEYIQILQKIVLMVIVQKKVIEYCLKLVPDATLMRTHGLIQSTNLLTKIFKEFPQLKIDISTFTYHFPTVTFFKLRYEGLIIKRLNYN